MTEVSRRTVLAGVAATAATAAFGSITVPLSAVARAKPEEDQISKDLEDFVLLSEKLTGIPGSKLAPGVDAVGVASVYLKEAGKVVGFDSVLQAFKATPTDETVAHLMQDTRTMYLCRSIILAWYLGAWYEPDTLEAEANRSEKATANKLKAATGRPPVKRYNLVQCRVISPKTYTQGWVWRIAQAHPMGYANRQFGYWSEKPQKDDFMS
jgi:hypothetical protein